MTESTPVNPDSSAGALVDYAEIIVVRHGETAWNADGRIQGHLDVELNHVGRQQAAAVANRISKEMKISAVYSSDLKRAMETAHIIANTCGIPEVNFSKNFYYSFHSFCLLPVYGYGMDE
ncbi:hypothetical protein Pint_08849 [Pistacia integerrima]|uniref:Uncharacterized protein n=1 Tax=Pistacia integerrima TaxID=434235 RepID=A0ACC0XTZ6_9ROSI|nr:hypothetical protein Pint_08849 [Pistacia integerrima]